MSYYECKLAWSREMSTDPDSYSSFWGLYCIHIIFYLYECPLSGGYFIEVTFFARFSPNLEKLFLLVGLFIKMLSKIYRKIIFLEKISPKDLVIEP